MKKLLLSLFGAFLCLQSFAQLVLNEGQTVEWYVENVLVGAGVTVSNITYTGKPVQFAEFTNGDATNIGIDEGLLMSNGRVEDALGPNNEEGRGDDLNNSTQMNDVDLQQVVTSPLYDLSIIEFDFIPQGKNLNFEYVFASEEYPEYVNQAYNDVFGFFISGPGINGTYSNNAINIAQIPNTTTAVSINNLNDGEYNQYYVDNADGQTIQFDGFTTPLVAQATVQPCETYHIKLVISDAGDGVFDSGVFLRGGSFSSTGIKLTNEYEKDAVGDFAVEGCYNGAINIRVNQDVLTDSTINFTIGGTAINGVDYETIATSVTIPAGERRATIPIIPIKDDVIEGTETVILTFETFNVCTGASNEDIILEIDDDFKITADPFIIDCANPVVTPNVNGTGHFQWFATADSKEVLGTSDDSSPSTALNKSELVEFVGDPGDRTYTVWVEDLKDITKTVHQYTEDFKYSWNTSYAHDSLQLLFDAHEDFTLDEMTVRITSTSDNQKMVVNIKNPDGSIVDTYEQIVPNTGWNDENVTLTGMDLQIPQGTGYIIDFIGTGGVEFTMIHKAPENWYPVTFGTGGTDIFSITGNSPSLHPTNKWGTAYMFDWVVKAKGTVGGTCGRMPVEIVEDCPCTPPSITVVDHEVDEGNALPIESIIDAGSGSITSHLWGGDVSILDATDIQNVTVSDQTAPGVYTLTYAVANSDGCSSKKIRIKVSVHDTVSVCNGEEYTLEAPSKTGVTVLQWKDIANDSIIYTNNNVNFSETYVDPEVSPEDGNVYEVKIVEIYNPDDNFIENGDFEDQATYDYADVQHLTEYPETHYKLKAKGPNCWAVGTNPQIDIFDMSIVPNPWPNPWYVDLKDHTKGDGTGNMMIFDGVNTDGIVVFQSKVNVIQGEEYVFSGWFANIHWDRVNPFEMEFEINGQKAGVLTGSDDNEWYQFYTIWEADVTGEIDIKIVNSNIIGKGNDFAIDDLVFAKVASQKVKFTVYDNPDVVLEDQEVCEGSDYTVESSVTLETGASVETHAWTGNAEILQSSDIADPALVTTNDDATYSLIYTVTDDNGCTGTDTAQMLIKPLPVIDLGEDQEICEGETFTIDAGIAQQYEWSNGEATQSITVDATDTYTVTITNDECPSEDEITVTVNPLPVVDLGNDAQECGIYTIDAGDGFDAYVWSTGQTTQTIDVTATGDYSVTVTQNNCEASDEIHVQIDTNYELDLGDDIVHCGDTTIVLNAGIGDVYMWSNGESTQEISVTETGVYDVTVQNGACEGNGSINITITPIPDIDLGNDIAECETYTIDAGDGFDSYVWSTGETTQPIAVTATDDYSVTVSKDNCENSDVVHVEISEPFTVELGADRSECDGTDIDLDAGEGDTYIWSTGESTQTVTVAASGTYEVTVERGTCQAIGSVEVEIKPIPEIDLGADIEACEIYILDAGDSYDSYVWSTGETTQSIDVTESGDYSLTITVAGCENSDIINADITKPFSVDLGTDRNECEGVDITVDAGSGDTYLWNDGNADQIRTITASADYSVTVTNGHCEASGSVNVEIIPNVTPLVEISASETEVCEGTEIVFTIDTEENLGTAPLYTWSVNDVEKASTKEFASSDLTGNTTVTLVAQSSERCVTADIAGSEVYVTINPNLTPSLILHASELEICDGDQIEFTISDIENEGDDPKYEWFINDNPALEADAFVTTDLNDGDIVSVVLTSSEECVTSETFKAEQQITVNSFPVFNLGEDVLLCSNETGIIQPDVDVDLLWNDGSTDQARLIKAPGGEYIATADNNGCETSDTVSVSFTYLSDFSILGKEVMYRGDTAFYEVSVEFAAYLWNNSEMKRNITVNPDNTESYWVAVEDTYECKDTSFITLEVLPRPEINIQVQPFCEGESRTLTVQDDFDVYEWSTGESSKSITVSEAGEYIIKASRTDEPGITLLDTITVTVIENPEFTISDDVEICNGEVAEVGTGFELMYQYRWSNGGRNETIEVTQSGEYTLTVSAFGCETVKSVNVTVHKVPDAPIIDPLFELCYNDELPVLMVLSENTSWYSDETVMNKILTDDQLIVADHFPAGIAQGSSELFYLQAENDNCKSPVVQTEVKRNLPVTELEIGGNEEYCIGDELQPFAVDGLLKSFNWEFEGAEFSHSDDGTAFFSFYEEGAFTLYVHTTDEKECLYTAQKSVTVNPLPDVELSASNFEGEVTFTNLSYNETKTEYYWKLPPAYEWEPVETDEAIVSLDYGSHSTVLKAISNKGCIDSVSQGIYVTQPMTLFVPNAIHPDNAAQKVREFLPVGMNLEYYEIWIYDNFQNTVWYSNQLDENGSPAEAWEGKTKGNLLKTDVYKWKIVARFENDTYWTNRQDIDQLKAKEGIWGNLIIIR